ncbi:unnamed protein product, partial [Amoebophrya sp. A120]|eukprot:GSA120T00009576001.1
MSWRLDRSGPLSIDIENRRAGAHLFTQIEGHRRRAGVCRRKVQGLYVVRRPPNRLGCLLWAPFAILQGQMTTFAISFSAKLRNWRGACRKTGRARPPAARRRSGAAMARFRCARAARRVSTPAGAP